MRFVLILALLGSTGGCAAVSTGTGSDAEYRRGDQQARLADERLACQRSGGVVLQQGTGRVSKPRPGMQFCVLRPSRATAL